jgi:hypothetical protein
MEKLCEGPMFPGGMMGHYDYYYYVQERTASENKEHGWNNCQIKKVKREPKWSLCMR